MAIFKCELSAVYLLKGMQVSLLLKALECWIDNDWIPCAELDAGVIYEDQWVEHQAEGDYLTLSEGLVLSGRLHIDGGSVAYDAMETTILYIETSDLELGITGSEVDPKRFNFAPVKGRVIHHFKDARLVDMPEPSSEAAPIPMPTVPVVPFGVETYVMA